MVIVSIIVTIFSKLIYDKKASNNYVKINEISNQLKKSQYSNTNLNTKILNIKKDSITSSLIVNEIIYLDDDIKLKKYELKN